MNKEKFSPLTPSDVAAVRETGVHHVGLMVQRLRVALAGEAPLFVGPDESVAADDDAVVVAITATRLVRLAQRREPPEKPPGGFDDALASIYPLRDVRVANIRTMWHEPRSMSAPSELPDVSLWALLVPAYGDDPSGQIVTLRDEGRLPQPLSQVLMSLQ